MRTTGYAALGLAAYSVFLVATIPAAWVGAQLQAALPGRVEVSNARGTLWRGEARVSFAPSRNRVTLDALEWSFAPTRLFAGEVAFDSQARGRGLQAAAQIAQGFAGWRVRGLKADGDAAGLAIVVPIVAAWRPAGPIAISSPGIEIRGREVRGTMEAQWRDASTALSDVRPLGSYRATWKADGGPGKIEVTTLRGPLRVTGTGTTSASSGFTFNGDARGEGEAAKMLEPLLDLMGPRRPDGARALELRLE
jgi:general secretion pathway protein N